MLESCQGEKREISLHRERASPEEGSFRNDAFVCACSVFIGRSCDSCRSYPMPMKVMDPYLLSPLFPSLNTPLSVVLCLLRDVMRMAGRWNDYALERQESRKEICEFIKSNEDCFQVR